MRKRRLFSILSVLIIILFTACNGNSISILPKSPEVPAQFSAEMQIKAGELEVSADVKRYGTEFWEMTVTSPENLAGLTVSADSEGVTATYEGLTLDIPVEDIRDRAVYALVFRAVDNAAAAGKLDCTETDYGMAYNGEFSGYAYTLTFHSESMAPLLLEIPAADFSAEFKNVNVDGMS